MCSSKTAEWDIMPHAMTFAGNFILRTGSNLSLVLSPKRLFCGFGDANNSRGDSSDHKPFSNHQQSNVDGLGQNKVGFF